MTENETIDLNDLSLFWRARANALRILDGEREQSHEATIASAEAYEECAKENRAALSQPAREAVLEEAAKVCDQYQGELSYEGSFRTAGKKDAGVYLAAAIRALKSTPPKGSDEA